MRYVSASFFLASLLGYFFSIGALVAASFAATDASRAIAVVSVQTFGAVLGTILLRIAGRRMTWAVNEPALLAALCAIASLLAAQLESSSAAWALALLMRSAAGTVLLAIFQAEARCYVDAPIDQLNRSLQVAAMAAFITALTTAPLFGGAGGASIIFALDAAGSVLLAILLHALRKRRIQPSPIAAPASALPRAFGSTAWILYLTAMAYAGGGAFQVLEVPRLKSQFLLSPGNVTMLFVATGLCNLIAVKFAPRSLLANSSNLLCAAAAAMIASTLGFLVASNLMLALALALAFGLANGLFTLAQTTELQTISDAGARTRAFVFARLASQSGLLVGCAIAATGSQLADRTTQLLILGLLILAAAATIRAVGCSVLRHRQRAVVTSAALLYGVFANGEAAASQKLRLPVRAIPHEIDPLNLSDVSAASVTFQIFETLFTYDSGNILVPLLAESYTFGADGLSINIRIRTDRLFSDGTPVVADHVIATLTRTASVLGNQIAWAMRDIKGFDEFVSDKSTSISGVVKTGEHSLRIELIRPSPRLLQIFAAWFAVGLEKNGRWIGSGSYAIDTFVPDRQLTLRARARPRPVFIDQIEYIQAETQEKQIDLLNRRELDIAAFDTSVNLQVAGYDRTSKEFLQTIVAVVNEKRQRFRDAEERCNFVSAVKQAVTGAAYQWHAINQGLPFAWSIFADDTSTPPRKRSPPRRVELLLTDSAATFDAAANEQLSILLKSLGYEVTISKLPVRAMIDRLRKGTYDTAMFGYMLDYADPDALFLPLLGTSQQYNFVGFSDPGVDALLEVSHDLTDRDSRNIVFHSIMRRINRDCRVSLVGSQKQAIFSRSGLKLPDLSSFGFYRLPIDAITDRSTQP